MNTPRFILLLLAQLALSAFGAEPKPATITCRVYHGTGGGIFLYKIENGEAVSLGFRRPVAGADTCMFSVPLQKEGVYFLQKVMLHSSEFKNVIYLKPGDQKRVDYYLDKLGIADSCVVRKPNPETVCLQSWVNRFVAVYKLAGNRKKRPEFFAAYQKLIKDAPAVKARAVPVNHYFKQLFADKQNTDIQFLKAAAFFYNVERLNGGCDTAAERQHFYQALAGETFCDARLLQSEHGLQLVKFTHGYQLFQRYPTPRQMQEVMMNGTEFAGKAGSICNEAVRAAYVLNRMEQISNYEVFKRDVQPFKKLFASPAYKAAYDRKEEELTVYAKGAPAYNFSLTDVRDSLVSLSDFKGKVVVLDVWAMWCGPCLMEKPFFQKTEEAFKERNDIVFVSVSHDGLSKKRVWKNFVGKRGWNGIELLANYNESIGNYYKISGIPRFMIFDKEGKIVTVDAPRPSDPAFKKLIDQTLQNN